LRLFILQSHRSRIFASDAVDEDVDAGRPSHIFTNASVLRAATDRLTIHDAGLPQPSPPLA
jgi:hypothetical protein